MCIIRACDFAVNLPWHSCRSPMSQIRPLFPLASGKEAMCLKTGTFPRTCFISWPEKMADSLDWWLWISLKSGNMHDRHPLEVCECMCPCHTIANCNSQLLLSVILWCWWKYFIFIRPWDASIFKLASSMGISDIPRIHNMSKYNKATLSLHLVNI